MRRILPIVLAVAVVAAVIFFLRSGSTTDPPDSEANRLEGRAAIPENPDTPPTPEAPSGIREVVPQAPTDPNAPPKSYLAALGTITGRVVDADHTPMPDFPVALLGAPIETLVPTQASWLEQPDFDLALTKHETTTDKTGRFTIDQVDPSAYHLFRLGAGTNREKFDVCLAQPDPGKVSDVGDLELDKFAVLTGRVVDSKGVPVAAARVRATQMPEEFFKFGGHRLVRGSAVAFKIPGTDGWQVYDLPPILFRLLDLLPYRETKTGDDGAFRLEGVPLGMITIAADKEHFLLNVRGPINTQAGGEKAIGDVKIGTSETLKGRVIDGSDKPVEGARVLAGNVLSIFPVALLTPLPSTTSLGEFAFDGFTDEAHVVAARRKGASTYKTADDVVPGIDEPEIRVDETTTLTVRATDEANQPIAGVTVLVQPQNEMSEMPLLQPPLQTAAQTHGKEDGSVEVEGLSRAKFKLFVKKDGYAIGKADADLTQGPASVDVKLEKERVGTVRVVAKGSGKPIEHALVVALDRDKDGEHPSPIPIAPIATARTDKDGIALLKGLEAGPTFVRAVHPSYAQIDGELTVPGSPITLELTGGGNLKGKLLRDGVVITETHFVLAIPKDIDKSLPRLTLASAKDGTYEFTRLPAGEYFVQAAKKTEELFMRMGGGAQGNMMMGNPLGMGLGSLFAGTAVRSTTVVDDSSEDSAGGAEEPPRSEANREGNGVHVTIGNKDRRQDTVANKPPADVDPGYRAVVKEGQDTYLEIDLARLPGDFEKGRLSGLVTINGEPGADLIVSCEQTGGGTAKSERTAANGRFDLGEVPAGALRVHVIKAHGESTSDLSVTKVTVEPSDAKQLELRIEAGRLEGAVRAASNGRTVEEARVRIVPLTGKDETDPEGCFLLDATDSTGRFHFDVVPGGRYRLEVTKQGFASASTTAFEVPQRGLAPRQEVRLIENVPVDGTVELPPECGVPEMLFVRFPGKAELDFTSFVFVDPKTKKFEVPGVAPGEYDVEVYGSKRELKPVRVTVPVNGLKGCVLRPELKPEPPPLDSIPTTDPKTDAPVKK